MLSVEQRTPIVRLKYAPAAETVSKNVKGRFIKDSRTWGKT